MATSENMISDFQPETDQQQGIIEALLRSEIIFWRDMIETSQQTETRDSLERMRQALALAESRLAQRPSNVYHLDQARRVRK